MGDFLTKGNAMNPGPMPPPACVQHDVPLAAKTTLQVGGPARFYIEAEDAAGLGPAVAWARACAMPVWVLGGGSNVVVHDAGLEGLVVRLSDAGRPWARTLHGDGIDVVIPGGADWSATVQQAVGLGLYGIECLAGIPGQVGAAPVQNIGAYGQELSDTLTAVERLDMVSGTRDVVAAADCGLGYRQSHFRGLWRGRYLITAVHLRLRRALSSRPLYPALTQALLDAQIEPLQATPSELATQVLALRQAKGMVWGPDSLPSVGSFFVNPEVCCSQGQALMTRFGPMPQWPSGPRVKLSAAWLIEAAGMPRGWRHLAVGGRVGLSPQHALALVNLGGASAKDILATANEIYRRVLGHFGVALAAEARPMGFATLPPPFASTAPLPLASGDGPAQREGP